MQIWEYKVVRREELLEADLCILGDNGWELASVMRDERYTGNVKIASWIFKRPLPETVGSIPC